MQTIGQQINFDELASDFKNKKVKKSNHSTRWQVDGSRYARLLGAKKPSDYAHIIKCCKNNPGLAEVAYNFVVDYPNPRSLLKLFYWKYYQLVKERKSNGTHK